MLGWLRHPRRVRWIIFMNRIGPLFSGFRAEILYQNAHNQGTISLEGTRCMDHQLNHDFYFCQRMYNTFLSDDGFVSPWYRIQLLCQLYFLPIWRNNLLTKSVLPRIALFRAHRISTKEKQETFSLMRFLWSIWQFEILKELMVSKQKDVHDLPLFLRLVYWCCIWKLFLQIRACKISVKLCMRKFHACISDWKRCENLLHQLNAYYVWVPYWFPLEYFAGFLPAIFYRGISPNRKRVYKSSLGNARKISNVGSRFIPHLKMGVFSPRFQ